MAKMCAESQLSRAATRETYSLLALSAMASSTYSIFVAVQLVVKHQSDLALCTAVNYIKTTLFLVPVMEKGGRVNGIRSVAFSPAKTTHVALAGQDGATIIDIRQPNQ